MSRLGRVAVLALLAALAAEGALRLLLGNLGVAQLYLEAPGDGRCVGLRPGTAVVDTGALLAHDPTPMDVNRLGFRGPEVAEARAPGLLRVAVLGDSFTYGMGVGHEQAIPARLQAHLRAAGQAVEVLNFGMPGVDLPNLAPQYRLFARRWRPDLVLYLVEGGDLHLHRDGALRSVCEVAALPAWARRAMQGSYLARLPLFAWILWTQDAAGRDDPERQARVAQWEEGVERLRHAVEADGARLAVYATAGLPRLRDGDVGAALDRSGLPWGRVDEGLEGHRLLRDGHYDAAGCDLVARRLQGLLPAFGQGAAP